MPSSALPKEGMLAAVPVFGNQAGQVVESTLKAACVGCMMLRQGSISGLAKRSPIAMGLTAASCLTSDNAKDDLSGPHRSL